MPKNAKQIRANLAASLPKGGAVQSKSAKKRARKRNASAGRVTTVPVNMARTYINRGANINGRSGHSIVIAHREYVCDVTAYANFTVADGLPINPGRETLFPWLGTIARKYESYTFRSLRFSYEPFVSSATAGVVYLAIDFDAKDTKPNDKSELTAFAGCVKSQVWAPCVIDANSLDLAKMIRERYTRGPSLPSDVDAKTYDVGQLFVASFGGAGAACGEIYVEYEVELITPQADMDSTLNESAKIVAGGTVNRAAPFGSVPVLTGLLPVSTLNDTITFWEPGEYLLATNFAGTTIAPGVSPTLGGTATSSNLFSTKTDAAAAYGSYSARINATNPGETVTLDFTPVAAALSGMTGILSRFSYTL